MRFPLSLNERELAPRSLSLYLEAIAFQSKALGWADNTMDFRVRRMVEGFKRGAPQQADGRGPIIPTILLHLSRVSSTICLSEFKGELF